LRRAAEFGAQLPVNLKIRGLKEKYVLREACKDLLIPEVYDRPKHPFMSPPAKATGDAMAGFVADTLSSSALEDQPFYEPKAVRRLLEQTRTMEPADRAVAEAPLLSVVSATLMHQRFGMTA
jgi:asparagine synthase (glutamine-hydrolysing)